MKALPVQGVRDNPQVGVRLRNARLARRYTLEQTANLAGVTKGFLSRVERDLTSPSVASLVTLCQVLGIEVGSLFEAPRTSLIRFEDATCVDMGGSGIDERLITGRDERRVQMLRGVIQPGGEGESEPYAIDCELEVWHVVSGEIEVTLHDEVTVLKEGDTLTFPGREPHTWRNVGSGEAVVIFVLIPDGSSR